jgi:hypothetical protein
MGQEFSFPLLHLNGAALYCLLGSGDKLKRGSIGTGILFSHEPPSGVPDEDTCIDRCEYDSH